MSMFISSFLPNGNCLIAADTRVSQTRSDGFLVPLRDDFHKIVQLSDKSFIFMSGASNMCKIVVDKLRDGFRDETANDRLIKIGNYVMSHVNKDSLEEFRKTSSQVMAFFLIQIQQGMIHAYLYLSSCKFEPLEYNNIRNECVVLGAFIPGCDKAIKANIGNAKIYADTIQQYRNMFNSQSGAEVGGNLEMYELSPVNGLVRTMKYKILESNYMDCLPPLLEDGHLTWGVNNVPNKQRWAATSTGPWHDTMQSGDIWCCDWNYATESWGVPYKKVGQDGANGRPGSDGSDADVTRTNIENALAYARNLGSSYLAMDSAGAPILYGGKIYGSEIYAGGVSGSNGVVGTGSVISLTDSGIQMYNNDNDTNLEIASSKVSGVGTATTISGGGALWINSMKTMIGLYMGTSSVIGMQVGPSGTEFAGPVNFSGKVTGVTATFA